MPACTDQKTYRGWHTDIGCGTTGRALACLPALTFLPGGRQPVPVTARRKRYEMSTGTDGSIPEYESISEGIKDATQEFKEFLRALLGVVSAISSTGISHFIVFLQKIFGACQCIESFLTDREPLLRVLRNLLQIVLLGILLYFVVQGDPSAISEMWPLPSG